MINKHRLKLPAHCYFFVSRFFNNKSRLDFCQVNTNEYDYGAAVRISSSSSCMTRLDESRVSNCAPKVPERLIKYLNNLSDEFLIIIIKRASQRFLEILYDA